MTNDRAAEIMKAIIFIIPHEYYSDEVEEAIHMAINALQAQDLNKQVTGKLNSADDTISRQAAIEAVEFGITYAKAIDVNTGESKELFKEGNDALKKASERIKDLPSAQAETPEPEELDFAQPHKKVGVLLEIGQPEIIRCKECKHWLDIDDGRQKHRMCADIYGDWFCADAERRSDG